MYLGKYKRKNVERPIYVLERVIKGERYRTKTFDEKRMLELANVFARDWDSVHELKAYCLDNQLVYDTRPIREEVKQVVNGLHLYECGLIYEEQTIELADEFLVSDGYKPTTRKEQLYIRNHTYFKTIDELDDWGDPIIEVSLKPYRVRKEKV